LREGEVRKPETALAFRVERGPFFGTAENEAIRRLVIKEIIIIIISGPKSTVLQGPGNRKELKTWKRLRR
jgi:hypothetical protein